MQEELWQECRRIIKDAYKVNGESYCYTCGNECDGVNRHLGHFLPKGSCGMYLKYHLDNLRIQCFRCNIHLGGNGGEFGRKLEQEIGKEKYERLFKLKHKT